MVGTYHICLWSPHVYMHRLAFPSDTHYPSEHLPATSPGRGSSERNKRSEAAADARIFCNDVMCIARWPIAFCRCTTIYVD